MFKIKNYILTPKDLYIIVKGWTKKMIIWDYSGIILILALSFILVYLWALPLEPIIFWLFILAIVYWNLDSRISIGLALACLITIPFLLILFNKNILLAGEDWAEQVAVWAYYFLVIGVVKQIVEYAMENREEKTQQNK